MEKKLQIAQKSKMVLDREKKQRNYFASVFSCFNHEYIQLTETLFQSTTSKRLAQYYILISKWKTLRKERKNIFIIIIIIMLTIKTNSYKLISYLFNKKNIDFMKDHLGSISTLYTDNFH